MKNHTLLFALFLGLSPLAAADDEAEPSNPFLPLHAGLVALNSAEGRSLLGESSAGAFWSLIGFYPPNF
jgi:hypothetical protein